MSADDDNSWQETVYLLRTPENVRRLMEAVARDKASRRVPDGTLRTSDLFRCGNSSLGQPLPDFDPDDDELDHPPIRSDDGTRGTYLGPQPMSSLELAARDR
jgi:hypothetical protein